MKDSNSGLVYQCPQTNMPYALPDRQVHAWRANIIHQNKRKQKVIISSSKKIILRDVIGSFSTSMMRTPDAKHEGSHQNKLPPMICNVK